VLNRCRNLDYQVKSKAGTNWYALHTRNKSEKIAKQYFEENSEIITYVPTIRRTKKYSRKIKHYDIPLIRCYVFVKINLKQRVEVFKNPYVIQFLTIGNEIYPIPENEIDTLKKVTGHFPDVELTKEERYQIGDEVEVIGGYLTGLKGYIIRDKKNQKNVVIELKHIGFQLRLQIDPAYLRRVNKLVA